MAKKLYLYFTNEDEQPTTIIVQHPNQNLDGVAVRSFMEKVMALELFEHKGQLKYANIKGAKYMDKKTDVLF
ncbi:DUF2922 domain-containing protein [Vagococcus sp. BWB3-3]|uniref:DUF2922 domain-containing protein n=1 Tax=Vagococcus allomyrinae TaxID=2794353 RepID=A0A940P7X0_9ENTE|nr:DUF2922 domain-containing protein [Vagococcus allomyrinae]MBP1040089.1 DUF2922 domain-containing protein [Vagococcus allomyrinae]